jgi:predicted amidophosphoribosyltransferase
MIEPSDDELKSLFTDDAIQAITHVHEIDRYVCGLCNESMKVEGHLVIYGNRGLNLCEECFKKLNDRMNEMIRCRKEKGELHPHVSTTEGIEALKEMGR